MAVLGEEHPGDTGGDHEPRPRRIERHVAQDGVLRVAHVVIVCFEVMLVASFILISLGGRKKQLKESITYVAINVISSWFFLIAIAYLYGTVGTLNFAHLSQRIAEVGQGPLLTMISIIFLLVFSLKAGLLLYSWLPGSYSAPPPAVAALFGALLTKVGIYAMFRVFTLLFYHEPSITHTIIGVMARFDIDRRKYTGRLLIMIFVKLLPTTL